ncbi:MAG: acyltransferase [Candidatus Ornithomonoglobus sp.]
MKYNINDREEWNTYTPRNSFKSKLKYKILKLIFKEKTDSESYIKYLRQLGVKIGKGTYIRAPRACSIDTTTPWLLEIGDYVKILKGVTILTHDFSWSVMAGIEGNILGGMSKVKIGNNVFLGMNSTVLRGVTIGDNVIIGAGAIVSKDCKPNSVYAGAPAKYICSLEEFYEKKKKRMVQEAKDLAWAYYDRFGSRPDEYVMREYSMLFADRDKDINEDLEMLMMQSGHYEKCLEYFKKEKSQFNGLDEFLDYCEIPNY